jgi:GNAT superfamily N-acetyltransferase
VPGIPNDSRFGVCDLVPRAQRGVEGSAIAGLGRVVCLAPLRTTDRGPVLQAVGPTVDDLYPRGAAKLEARLNKVIDGRANATVAWRAGDLAGLAVDSPKGLHAAKLSTLWVAPAHRRNGVGSTLVSHTTRSWLMRNIERGHLTVRRRAAVPIERLLLEFGFQVAHIALHRYGCDEDEVILTWSAYDVRNEADDQILEPPVLRAA